MSVNLLDRQELECALAYLAGALPCRAKSVALVTVDGELVGQYLARHDSRQLEALVNAAHDLTGPLADALDNGPVHYTLTVGASGATLLWLLDRHYVVAVTVRELRSVDALVSAAREGLPPLLDLLGAR